ncbi:MAG: biopolymer transporter ExbD [Thiohalocapsa sp.]
MDSMNVIPFIDIMLVLLAIVLTTATFIVDGRLEIRLPESAAQIPRNLEARVDIAVDRQGSVFVDTLPKSLEALSSYLATLEPKTPVTLRVDAGARFSAFVAVVDLLKSRGMTNLSILTRQPES